MDFSTATLPELLALQRMIYVVKFVLDEDEALEFAGSSVVSELAQNVTRAYAAVLQREGKHSELRRLESWIKAENHPHALDRLKAIIQRLPGWDQSSEEQRHRLLTSFLCPLQAQRETLEGLCADVK